MQTIRPRHLAVSLLLIRLLPGFVFLSEGIQKFLFADTLGAGRFAKIGFSHPGFWASFTGGFEIACGCLLILGWMTRMAVIPLLIVMVVAFVTTKWPELTDKGFWVTVHDYRTDLAMTVTLIVTWICGPGAWSVDARRASAPLPPQPLPSSQGAQLPGQ